MRRAFNFYKSYYDVMGDLDKKQKVEFIDALMKVQFFDLNINDVSFTDRILTIVWNAVKHSVLKQIEGYCNANRIAYESLFIDTSDAYEAVSNSASPQEEEEVKVKVKEKGQANTSLRSATLSLSSSKDNNTHKPREVYSLIQDDDRFDEDSMEVAEKFIQYRDDMYSSTKDKKYGLRTTRAIIGFMKEISQTSDYLAAFQLMEDKEWATFDRSWVKGDVL